MRPTFLPLTLPLTLALCLSGCIGTMGGSSLEDRISGASVLLYHRDPGEPERNVYHPDGTATLTRRLFFNDNQTRDRQVYWWVQADRICTSPAPRGQDRDRERCDTVTIDGDRIDYEPWFPGLDFLNPPSFRSPRTGTFE